MESRQRLSAGIIKLVNEVFDELETEAEQKVMARLAGRITHGSPVALARSSRTVRVGGRRGAAKKLSKGGKRDPKVIAKLVESLFAYVKGHPGERIEQVGLGMGVTTRELNLPVKKLIATKRIRTTGEKRATRYFPKGR